MSWCSTWPCPNSTGWKPRAKSRGALPKTEVLIFTGEESEQLIHEVFAAGARSYILKSDISAHLVAAIRALGEHKHYFTDRISEVVFARYFDGESGAGKDKTEGLTPREREIVQLLGEGKSNKETAARPRDQHQDGGDSSRRDHAQAAAGFLCRPGALRHPQQDHRGVGGQGRIMQLELSPRSRAESPQTSQPGAACFPSSVAPVNHSRVRTDL